MEFITVRQKPLLVLQVAAIAAVYQSEDDAEFYVETVGGNKIRLAEKDAKNVVPLAQRIGAAAIIGPG